MPLTLEQKQLIIQVLHDFLDAWDTLNRKHLKIFVAAEVIPFGASRSEKILREVLADYVVLFSTYQTVYLALLQKMGIGRQLVSAELESAKVEVVNTAQQHLRIYKDLLRMKFETFQKTYPTVRLDTEFYRQLESILAENLTAEVLIEKFLAGLPL